MTFRLKQHSLLLAALLQLLPLVKQVFTHPAALSAFSIVMRWGLGTTAVVGTFDAASAASPVYTTSGNFAGSVGSTLSGNVSVNLNGQTASSSDYFIFQSGSTSSPLISNGANTSTTLPPGVTFTASWVNGSGTMDGYFSGTPTTPGTYNTTITVVSPGNGSLAQNLTFTITGVVTPTPPAITAQPIGTNVIAGRRAVFSASASGTTPLVYRWAKNNSPLADGGNISGSSTSTLIVSNVAAGDVANYSVTVTNSLGSATSSNAALTVILPPSIGTQPQPQNATIGGSASFSVAASGTAPFGYRWLKNNVTVTNGVKFSGATTSTLGIATIAARDAGNYSVVVTNLAGSVTSSPAALVIVSSPVISTAPASKTAIVGTNVAFTVSASGSAPLFYFWAHNGNPLTDGGNISGSSTATLNLTSVMTTDAGNYSVIVSNSLGSATNSSATLTVLVPPSISTQPQPQNAANGGSASFSVVANGTAPFGYRWLKNNVTVTNGVKFSGANTATLGIAAAALTDVGNYSVVVTNSAGSVTSAPAALAVVSSPVISPALASQTVANGTNVIFSVNAAGSAPLFYFWSHNGNPIADGGNISGSSSATLNLAGVTTNDAGSYSVIVSNTLGTATTSASLAVHFPPVILTSPVSTTVVAGESTTFTATAEGTAPLTWQWRKNGTNISGANSASLSLVNISMNDAGIYSVTVANAVGSALGSSATLTVLTPPKFLAQPTNAAVTNGANATFTVTVSGSAPFTFQWSKDGNPLADGGTISGSSSNVLRLTGVTAGDVGSYSVSVANTVRTTNSASASLNVIVAPTIDVPPSPVAVVAGSSASFSVVASGTAPFSYQWRKDGVNIPGATASTFSFNSVVGTNAGNYSVVVSNPAGSATSTAASLTVYLPPAITTQPQSQYGALDSTVTLQVAVSGTAPFTYQWFKNGNPLADGGNISGANSAALVISSLTTIDLDIYSVSITNDYGSVTSSNASVSVNIAPMITAQPQSQNAARSNTVVLSVGVTGSNPLKFQWRKNGVKITGATLPTLTFTNATTNNSGSYSVVITNIYGQTTSEVATLKVFVAPKFVLQATNRAVKTGSNTVFRATVSGTTPMAYQWFKDGEPLADGGNISGANSNILKVAQVTTNDAGNYSLSVTNFAGGLTSSNATLTVLIPPVILSQPESLTVVESNSATFSVSASGTLVKFQWRKAGKNIPSATNATFAIKSARTNDAGIYSVLVTNRAGGQISSNVQLTILVPPGFVQQAPDRTVKRGITTVFAAKVKGTAPLNYQWFKDGNPLTDGGNITGAFSNVLTVAQTSQLDAGTYSLSVTNLAAGIVSSNAWLQVIGSNQDHGDDDEEHDRVAQKSSLTSITTPSTAATFLSALTDGSGQITLTAQGAVSETYTLQTSTNLADWQDTFTTNITATNGIWQMTLPIEQPMNFFRLKSAGPAGK